MRFLKTLITLSSLLFSLITYAQKSFTDARDGQTYRMIKLGNLYWMLDNLVFQVDGSTCLEDCETIRFYDYRALEGACPEGWRLPQMNEWNAFVDSFGDAPMAKMMEGNEKIFRVDFLDQFSLFEDNVLEIYPYGRMEGGELGKGRFIDFWTRNPMTDERFHMHLTPYSIMGHTHKHHLKPKKKELYRQFPVRCVCEAERIDP